MYDKEMFHHPPLVPLLLTPFVRYGSMRSAMAIEWLAHALCILAVALVGRRMLSSLDPPASATSPIFWIPLLGVSLDPVLTFVSRKLWLDGPLAGLTALSLALFYLSGQSRRRRLLQIGAGTALGLACMVKLSALLALPVAAYLLWVGANSWRERIVGAVWSGVPFLIVVLPWFISFYLHFGVLLPSWVSPDPELVASNPFIRTIVERPPYHYLLEACLLQPVILLCGVGYLKHRKSLAMPALAFPGIWFITFLGVLTLMGWVGAVTGYQMRYLAPMFPSIYLMLYALARESTGPRPVFLLVCVLCLVYAGIGGGIYLFVPAEDEIRSMLEWAGAFG